MYASQTSEGGTPNVITPARALTFERATTARHTQTGAIADCTIGRKHKGTFFEGEIIDPCLDGVLRKRARAMLSPLFAR